MSPAIIGALIAGVFAILAAVIGTGWLIHHSNKKLSQSHHVAVESRLTAVETVMHGQKDQVCKQHQESFRHAHKRINESEQATVKLSTVVSQLDKTTAVLAERVESQNMLWDKVV